MDKEALIELAALALKNEDKRRRSLGGENRPFCDTSDRYEVAARIVVEAVLERL